MSIKLDTFKKQTINTNSSHTYSDLHLDIIQDTSSSNTILRDIKADFDLAAIKNSLINLFNTVPGQKLLNPVFGLDLTQFLFEPISESMGRLIGDTIINGLNTFEPRVRVEKVFVQGQPDDNLYIVTLIISIPSLNIKQVSISGQLNNQGFIVS